MMTRANRARSDANPVTRRRCLNGISAGILGFSLADWLAMESVAKGAVADAAAGRLARAKQVLVVYEEGGISQMDTWDPKPAAPADHRSPYKPLATNVPGIFVTELMPQIARQVDKLSIVRSMTSTRVAGHMEGCQEFFKGYRFEAAPNFPDIGSVVAELQGSECRQLPPYIFCPGANMPNHISTTGFLRPTRAPWKLGTKSLGENVAAPGWQVASLQLKAGLTPDRLQARRDLVEHLGAGVGLNRDSLFATREQREHALELLTSPKVHGAFNLSTESDAVRDRYGRDHRGCCYLMGRKLIEAGVRFVTVTVIQPPDHVGRPNYGQPNGVFLNWDHHEGIYQNGPCGGPQAMSNSERYGLPHPVMMPSLDRALSALIEDLDQRGLLDETLLCFITEMGRTPRINKWAGRDHWARAMSIAFAGAGTPGGQVIGATDREAADVIDGRYTPYDYAATVYHKLGIDASQFLRKPDGTPVAFTDGGQPIRELF